MPQHQTYEQLKFITDTLLTNDDQATIYAAIQQLHTLFSSLTSVRGDKLEKRHDQESFLDGGVAISPNLAARCLLDPLRTVQFLRGIKAAIQAALRRFSGERIHILYAGCGPYATLLLPLTTQFEPEQIQLTLLDMHAVSITAVSQLIEKLGMTAYINTFVQADAITYQHPTNKPLHIVVSETMQSALAQEPQVAIMLNLLPQMHTDGYFIPENIQVDACLSNSQKEDVSILMQRNAYGIPAGHDYDLTAAWTMIGTVIELNRETISNQKVFPPTIIEIPQHNAHDDMFILITTITIFSDFCLNHYACELNFPRRIPDLNGVHSGVLLEFTYALSTNPGLQYKRLLDQAMDVNAY